MASDGAKSPTSRPMTVTDKLHAVVFRILIPVNIFTAIASAGQGKLPDTAPDVTVSLHNGIVSTAGSIERAKIVAKKMFAGIGVNIDWQAGECRPHQGLCVEVNLIDDESAVVEDQSELGAAFPYAGSTGHVDIRYDRVRNSAGDSRDLEPLLLAHVLVHELTHVLECLDRHSDAGIMKSRWTSEDFYDMRWKPLAFSQDDIELIRMGMQVLRVRAENRQEPASGN